MTVIGGYKMLKTPGLYLLSLFSFVFFFSHFILLYCFENILLKQGNPHFLSRQIQVFDLPSPFAEVDLSLFF